MSSKIGISWLSPILYKVDKMALVNVHNTILGIGRFSIRVGKEIPAGAVLTEEEQSLVDLFTKKGFLKDNSVKEVAPKVVKETATPEVVVKEAAPEVVEETSKKKRRTRKKNRD